MIVCQNCGSDGDQKFCPGLRTDLFAERIRMNYLLHKVAHTFWHLEKGFLYTLKELGTKPGIMQRKYLSGIRLRYQSRFPCCYFRNILCIFIFNLPQRTNTNRSISYKHSYFIVQAAMIQI